MYHDEKELLRRKEFKTAQDKTRIRVLSKRITGIRNDYENRGKRPMVSKLNKDFYFNKDRFWKRLKRNHGSNTVVEVDIEKIKEEFKKLFNTKIFSNVESEKAAEEEIKKAEEENAEKPANIEITFSEMQGVIKQLKNCKSIGPDGISNEYIKCCASDLFVQSLTSMYQAMFKHKCVPEGFNTSRITPIIKDKAKSWSDQANIRPISTSDSFANIFELILVQIKVKLILIQIESMKMSLFNLVSRKSDLVPMQCSY